jgi:Ca2+-binding RTX toxin-like protein
LADLALASQIIDFTGTVDNYATLGIAAAAGPASLSGSGTAATLSFGTVSLGGSGSETISVFNGAAGQADLLSGSITAHGGANFTNSGLGSFSGLGAGQATSQLGVALTATQSGSYSETLVVTGVGGNASGYSGAVGSETITVTGTVVGSYTLTTGHDTISAGNGTDTIYAAANTLSSGDSIAAGGGANTLALTGSGNFDLALPSTLSGIGTVTVAESASGTTSVTLRNNTSAAVDVGSVAGGSITILGAANSDVIDLGSGTDTITLGGKSETVNGGSGTDTFDVTAKTIAAAIHGGTGTNLLDVTGTGTVTMGASITGSFASATLLAGGTTFTANAQHGLAIVATTGTDTIRVGDASQSVTGPATVHVLATTATAGALISGVHAGSTLELVNGGPAALNASTTGITVTLDKASNLTLSRMGAITAIGSAGNDVITAGAQGQTLTGGAGTDTLVGYSGFGDIFSDTMAGLGGDKIMNFGGTDTIDITDLRGPVTETYTYAGGYTTVDVSGSAGSVSILLKGSYSAANLGFGGDGPGTVISYTGH